MPLLQIVCEFGEILAVGNGFTIIVAFKVEPEQPLAVGVMLKVTLAGLPDVLVKLPVIFPEPLVEIPDTLVLFLIQSKAVPETFPLKFIDVMLLSEQMVCEAGFMLRLGVGLIKTGMLIGIPTQPFAVGVIVKVVVEGDVVLFVKLPLMLPLPLAAIPIMVEVLSLVQLKTVPFTAPDKFIGVILVAEHIV